MTLKQKMTPWGAVKFRLRAARLDGKICLSNLPPASSRPDTDCIRQLLKTYSKIVGFFKMVSFISIEYRDIEALLPFFGRKCYFPNLAYLRIDKINKSAGIPLALLSIAASGCRVKLSKTECPSQGKYTAVLEYT
jgi:hypothetical protein